MKKITISFIVVAFLLSIVCYLVTFKLIISGILLVGFVLYYFFYLRKKFVEFYSKIERVHTCYYFINSFLITLSVKNSLEEAYESGIRLNNKNLNDQINELGQLNIYDRVKYLRGYFNLSIYKMFLNILDLYQDQGGNILNMSDNVIRECTRTEKTLSETRSIGTKHLVEFVILWLLSIGILVFMRFAISDFYTTMVEDPIFVPLIFVFFLICFGSIHFFFKTYTNLTIKEDSGSWKSC